ncbi:MAG: (d)CMP kinase [Bacteroidaceae bacterium]|nr:(d)CMP kinase [Bacteroidaceae bacterium]
MKQITIAIDGHSSCGKSTMAKQLARQLGYIYVDTGAMYRAVTLYAMRNTIRPDGTLDTALLQKRMSYVAVGFVLDKETGLPLTTLCGEVVEDAKRRMDVSARVSEVAALPFVREAMTREQKQMGRNGGIVMDGRDIGTVVFPDAELKVFVTASAEVRARRRFDELRAKGEEAVYEDILQNVKERDYIDSHREVAPLRQATDAILLDNSHMTREEQSAWLLEKARDTISRRNNAQS